MQVLDITVLTRLISSRASLLQNRVVVLFRSLGVLPRLGSRLCK